MEKCRWHRRFFSSAGGTNDAVQTVSALRCSRINFLKLHGESVDSVQPHGLYRRFTVRGSLRVLLRACEAPSPIRASYADPASDFGRKQGTSTSPGFGRAGPSGPGLFDK